MTVFDAHVARRLIFSDKELNDLFKKYKEKDATQDYGVKAIKKVYFIHILPHPYRVAAYNKEYLEEYPPPSDVSNDIEALIAKHGWNSFVHGLKLFVRRRVKLMDCLGAKRPVLPEIIDRIHKLRNIIR